MAEQEAAKYKLALYQSWHSAAFARQKKMPELAKILRQFDGPPPAPPTKNALFQKMLALNAAFGGKDLRGNNG
jgi:hypothetical protein